MIRSYRLNRAVSLAILALMAIATVVGARLVGRAESRSGAPASGLLVVANLRYESLAFVDVRTGSTRTLVVPGPPHEMVLAAGRLYVTLGRADALLEVDPAGPGILRSLALDGEPHGIVAAGDDLLVTLDRTSQLVRIDRASLTERSRVATGSTPHAVAFATNTAYVAEARDNQLRAVRAEASAVIAAGALPESVVVLGDLVVTGNAGDGTLGLYATEPLALIATVVLGGEPIRLAVLDAAHVVVALNDRAEAAVVDVKQRKVSRRVRVGGHPDGVCLDPTASYAGIASNEAGSIQVFRLVDWRLSLTFPSGEGPGSCLWLAGR